MKKLTASFRAKYIGMVFLSLIMPLVVVLGGKLGVLAGTSFALYTGYHMYMKQG